MCGPSGGGGRPAPRRYQRGAAHRRLVAHPALCADAGREVRRREGAGDGWVHGRGLGAGDRGEGCGDVGAAGRRLSLDPPSAPSYHTPMSDHHTAELLLALAACGKTAAAVDLLAAPRAGRALALVPSRDQQIALYQRLGAVRGVRAVQFYQLAGIVLARAGAPPDLLGDTARLGLVRALLLDLRDAGRLPVYAAVAHKRGFVAAVAELLADLGDADIAPEAFAPAAREPRDTELAEVYTRYVAFQEARGVADLPGRLRLARDALLAHPGLLDGYALLVADGFDQLTPIQLSLLAAAARCIPRGPITL